MSVCMGVCGVVWVGEYVRQWMYGCGEGLCNVLVCVIVVLVSSFCVCVGVLFLWFRCGCLFCLFVCVLVWGCVWGSKRLCGSVSISVICCMGVCVVL